MNWYKNNFYDNVSEINIEDVFTRIIIGDRFYSLIKTAQTQEMNQLSPQHQQRIVELWENQNKQLPYLTNKYNVPQENITNVLEDSKVKWKQRDLNRRRLEQRFINILENKKRLNQPIIIKDIAASLGLNPLQAKDIISRNGIDIRGKSSRISEPIKQKIIEIQQNAISKLEKPLSAQKVVNALYEQTGEQVGINTVVRVLNEANLSTRGQKSDPRLRHLLNKFWATKGKGFWTTLNKKNSREISQIINTLIDKYTKDPEDKKVLKQFFMEKVQLRDTLSDQHENLKNRPKEDFTQYQAREIISLNNQGLSNQEISKKVKLKPRTVDYIIRHNKYRNFQFQYNQEHPSYFMANR